ncbi:MAG: hypothetical protein JW807_08380 [Spirochaetes bacterium]|nr:hypothetical protein [Spirochaetota bacterium]
MIVLKKTSVIVLALLLGTAISFPAQAGPRQNFDAALVYLRKARMTSAVQAKSANLTKAKEQLILAKYDRGGYRASAMALTTQAIAKIGEFRLDRADELIDLAVMKVKSAIQAMRQEAAAKK